MAKFRIVIIVDEQQLARAMLALDGLAEERTLSVTHANSLPKANEQKHTTHTAVASTHTDGLLDIPLPKPKTKFKASEFADAVEKAGFSKHSTHYALQQLVKLKRISKTKKRGTYVVR